MKFIRLLIALVTIALACGCDKENKARIQNIDAVTQKLIAQQQEQARQLAEVRAQLSTLPVQMDKTQFDYFLKGQEKALFYQTNLLFLLLTVDKNIQSQFQLVNEAREAASRQAFMFHTNEMDVTVNCISQLITAVASQEKNIIESLSNEVQRSQANLSRDLAKQLQQLAADKSEATRLKAIEADLTRIQRDLASLALQFAGTNPAPQLPGSPGRR
jgi:hypothetical protein